MDSVGRQPAAELKLLYFTAGARLKCSRPYACPSAQSFPLFYNNNTGCAEPRLNKYHPILSLQRGNCLLHPARPEDKWRSWSHSALSWNYSRARQCSRYQTSPPPGVSLVPALAQSSFSAATKSSLGRHSYAYCFN